DNWEHLKGYTLETSVCQRHQVHPDFPSSPITCLPSTHTPEHHHCKVTATHHRYPGGSKCYPLGHAISSA
ncbi:hypothetical protein P7K49_008592, partial [Saguinus oedipus]